jgi:hypothetical protein
MGHVDPSAHKLSQRYERAPMVITPTAPTNTGNPHVRVPIRRRAENGVWSARPSALGWPAVTLGSS